MNLFLIYYSHSSAFHVKVEAVLRNYSALVLNYPRAQHLSLKKKKRSKNDFKGSVPALEELFISLLPADIKEQVSKPRGGEQA